MAEDDNICNYLHLPVQSGSDRLLKLMNRGHKVEVFTDLLQRAREYLPDVQIASDLICGFPTETEEDHRLTADLLRESMFKNCFIFKYSPRPGTAAFDKLPDDVPEEDKRRRNNELLAIQSENSDIIHQRYVGKNVRVFVESVSAKATKEAQQDLPGGGNVVLGWEPPREVIQLSGRTDGDLITMFEGDPSLIGQIVDVHVEHAAPLTLFGKQIKQKQTETVIG